MPSLIDESYFQGPLYIAQRGQNSVAADIQNYIARYQDEFLTAALGFDLMTDLYNGIGESQDLTDLSSPWQQLVNGDTFKNTSGWWPAFYSGSLHRTPLYNNNQNMKWFGFAAGANKFSQLSPLACYIYYQYMHDLNVQNTGMGFVKAKGESMIANPNFKLTDRWNDMCDSINVLWQYLATQGNAVFTSYDRGFIDYRFFERQNVFGI